MSCGGGSQYRLRWCDNPMPGDGGRWCDGEENETHSCNTEVCPGKSYPRRENLFKAETNTKLKSLRIYTVWSSPLFLLRRQYYTSLRPEYIRTLSLDENLSCCSEWLESYPNHRGHSFCQQWSYHWKII